MLSFSDEQKYYICKLTSADLKPEGVYNDLVKKYPELLGYSKKLVKDRIHHLFRGKKWGDIVTRYKKERIGERPKLDVLDPYYSLRKISDLLSREEAKKQPDPSVIIKYHKALGEIREEIRRARAEQKMNVTYEDFISFVVSSNRKFPIIGFHK